MDPPAHTTALTMDQLDNLSSPQSRQLCKKRGNEETLFEINKEIDPGPMPEQEKYGPAPPSKNASFTSLHDKVTNLCQTVESNDTSYSHRFNDIEIRVAKLESQQPSTDVSNHSNEDQMTLADLAKRLEVLETFVYSMPMDLSKTIGKPKCIPPPSGFELDRRITALERVINVTTVQEGTTAGFEGFALQPVPWAKISANNDAGMSRSFSSFEQVPDPAEALNTSSSKYLTLPVPPSEIDPFQHPPSPAYPPSEGPQDFDLACSMGPEEQEFAWLSGRPQIPAASSARSEGRAENGSFSDIEKDRLK